MNKLNLSGVKKSEEVKIVKALPSQFPAEIREACVGCKLPLDYSRQIEGDLPAGFWTLIKDDKYFFFLQADLVRALMVKRRYEAVCFYNEKFVGKYIAIPGDCCSRCK